MLSKMSTALVRAYDAGWRVGVDGTCRKPDGSVQSSYKTREGYWTFDMHAPKVSVRVHRLAAVQLFGKDAVFERGVDVRHLDNNCGNNALSNIAIGTRRDNYYDNASYTNDRCRDASRAACRKLTDDDVRGVVEAQKQGAHLRDIAKTYGVSLASIGRVTSGRAYADVTGVVYSAKKPRVIGRKLTSDQAVEIVVRYFAENISQSELARHYGVTDSSVSAILKGRCYARETEKARQSAKGAA